MATRIRKRVCSTLLLFSWLFLLPGVASGEPVPPGPEAPGEVVEPGPENLMSVSDGAAMREVFLLPHSAPENVLFWYYADEDSLPWCLECPQATAVTLISKSFTTESNTSYVELDWTGQFTVQHTSTTIIPKGLFFDARLIRNGVPAVYFPGAGDDANTHMVRCDTEGGGPQWYGGYHGTIHPVLPNTSYTLVIRLQTNAPDGAYACFQHVTVRYD